MDGQQEIEITATAAQPGVPRPPRWQVPPNRMVTLSSGQHIIVRPVAVDDADRMVRFFAALTEQEIYYFFSLDEASARRLALEVASDPAYRLVAVGDLGGQQEVLGYIFLQWRDAGPPEYGVCLHRSVQSGGLGRLMIEHLLKSAAASGVGRVHLTVHPDNWRALRLYQRWGFHVVGDFVNIHQGVRQYRMEADLHLPQPVMTEEVTIIPCNGPGTGPAAAHIQAAIQRKFSCQPLLLDRPARVGGRVIFVADFAAPAGLPSTPAPSYGSDQMTDAGWIASLDARRLLVGGAGRTGMERAARQYAALVAQGTASSFNDLPFERLHIALPAAE